MTYNGDFQQDMVRLNKDDCCENGSFGAVHDCLKTPPPVSREKKSDKEYIAFLEEHIKEWKVLCEKYEEMYKKQSEAFGDFIKNVRNLWPEKS